MSETVSSGPISFSEEIANNQNPETKVDSRVVELFTPASSFGVRERGAIITKFKATSPTTGAQIDVLLPASAEDLEAPKFPGSHAMGPAGPYNQEDQANGKDIGGQHGPFRYANYHEFAQPDGPNGEKRTVLQAKRSDNGLSLDRGFVLTQNALTIQNTVQNPGDAPEQTSLGEHAYFSVEDGKLDGLKVNGMALDELLGENSQLVEGVGALFQDFNGEVTVDFPAGHSVKIAASFEGDTAIPLAMWIWRRPGSNFICFEPVVGVGKPGGPDDTKNGVHIAPNGSATLSTHIELL